MKALRVDLLAGGFVLLWSSGYVVGALATRDVAPLALTLWRFVVAAVVLAALAGWRRERWPTGRHLVAVSGVGVPIFAVQFGALYTAMAEGMPAPTTSLIACSSPLVVAVVGHVARWDPLTAVRWSGVGLGLTGSVITLADRVSRPPGAAALGWTLLGLAGLAGGTILQSRLRHSAGPAAVASVELAAAAAVLAVWTPLRGQVSIPLAPHTLGPFLWLALVAGVGAPLLLFALIRRRGATRASSYLFVVPGVTALGSWPILGTPVGTTAVIGLLVGASGLWLARPRPAHAPAPSRLERHRSAPWTRVPAVTEGG